MSLLLNILDKLPGAYSKDPHSNIGRLFQLFAAALSGVEEALQTVALWRDLDSARGATLDRIGANFGIARSPLCWRAEMWIPSSRPSVFSLT